MLKRKLVWVFCLALAGCSGVSVARPVELDSLSNIQANFAFSCKHEQLPEPSGGGDVLFQYARWLERNNLLQQDKSAEVQIERLYRIASESGHAKANVNLQNGALRSNYQLSGDEHLRMSQQLIDAQVASGYFFVGLFLQRGEAGLKKDPEMALRYYRKAADEGSAEAQGYIANKLAPKRIAPDIAFQMRSCAAQQGNGEAAALLGVYFQEEGKYSEAISAFQMGVAAGDEGSASFLDEGFRRQNSDDQFYYLGQNEDLERAGRYKKIGEVLGSYSYAFPKVPEINEIVPLPPAKLPPWDGKLKWLEEREANIPPPKPSEALIEQLAKAKGLDPATGKPLPGSQAFIRTDEYQICHSGQACPRAGYWRVLWSAERTIVKTDTVRLFKEGDIFPTWDVKRFIVRPWPLKDKITLTNEAVEWSFYGDA
jgi:tetratricopeptide (TPR) repeat protein